MHLAKEAGYRWCGYVHDDGYLGLRDCESLVKTAQESPADVFAVYTHQEGEDCRDVYALFSVEAYYLAGRHDENFDFYWADIDLFNRQVTLGLRPVTIPVTTLWHYTSRLHKHAVGHERIARDLIFTKDKTYFTLKHEVVL
jgi:hypothetical protein